MARTPDPIWTRLSRSVRIHNQQLSPQELQQRYLANDPDHWDWVGCHHPKQAQIRRSNRRDGDIYPRVCRPTPCLRHKGGPIPVPRVVHIELGTEIPYRARFQQLCNHENCVNPAHHRPLPRKTKIPDAAS